MPEDKEPTQEEIDESVARIVRQVEDTNPPNTKPGHPEVVTLSGRPRCEGYVGGAPCPIDPKTGMHQDYWILSDEERSKGFVRPVRTTYIHDKCHQKTYMNIKLAETYAVNPKFYGGTFCASCREHYPVAEFHWINNDGTTGEVMGT